MQLDDGAANLVEQAESFVKNLSENVRVSTIALAELGDIKSVIWNRDADQQIT